MNQGARGGIEGLLATKEAERFIPQKARDGAAVLPARPGAQKPGGRKSRVASVGMTVGVGWCRVPGLTAWAKL